MKTDKKGQMKITLKNVKINMTFSRETNCFRADVYVDGVKSGTAENDGNGGNTNVSWLYQNEDSKMRIKSAEKYCLSLPPYKSKFGEINMDLEFFIDNLIDEQVQKKEAAKAAKSLERSYSKGLVYGVKGSDRYKTATWKGMTIDQLMSSPKGVETIKNALIKIQSNLGPNETVWNTNLKNLI